MEAVVGPIQLCFNTLTRPVLKDAVPFGGSNVPFGLVGGRRGLGLKAWHTFDMTCGDNTNHQAASFATLTCTYVHVHHVHMYMYIMYVPHAS